MSDSHPRSRAPREVPAVDDEAARDRQVRAARVARHRRWADLQVEEAMRHGAFDNLPGSGKPLDLGDRHDPHWWVKRLIAREQIEGTTPPAIALRLEDDRLDAQLDTETTERDVRRRVEDFNRRVREARRQLTGGPPVITPTRDEDVELLRWRERRETRRARAEADRAALEAERRQAARSRRRGWWRHRRAADDVGAGEHGRARLALTVGAGALVTLVVAAVAGGVLGPGDDRPEALPSTPPAPQVSPAAPSTEPRVTPADTASAADADADSAVACTTARRPFRPTSVSIPGVQRRIDVVYPDRVAGGVPGTPALTTEGKTQMAYDTVNGIAPGAEAGNALFNAHTWPDGSALGNRLLEGLRVGDQVRVRGTGGRQLCYELVRRVEVPATVSGAQYYRRTGDPRMAIVVCSGDRSASGAWSRRTLFFAAPVGDDGEVTDQ